MLLQRQNSSKLKDMLIWFLDAHKVLGHKMVILDGNFEEEGSPFVLVVLTVQCN